MPKCPRRLLRDSLTRAARAANLVALQSETSPEAASSAGRNRKCGVTPLMNRHAILVLTDRGLSLLLLARSLGGRFPVFVPVKIPKLFKFHQLCMIICEAHVDRSRQCVLRIEIFGCRGQLRRMARDGNPRQPSPGELIAVEKISRRLIVHGRPRVHPDCIWKEGCFRGILCLLSAEEIRRLAIRTLRIKITIQRVASLVNIGSATIDEPSPVNPALT